MHLDHRLLIAATAALAVTVPVAAGAQTYAVGTTNESGPYLGAQFGFSSIDVGLSEWNTALSRLPVPSGSTVTSTSVDKGDFGWGLNAGYQVMRHFAVELGYLDLGKSQADVMATIAGRPGAGRADIKSSGVQTAVIGILPFDYGWAIDGRVGLFYGDNKVQVNGSTGSGSYNYENSGNKSTFLGGVGLSYNFYHNYQMRLDYLYIDKVGDAGKLGYTAPADLFSFGFRYMW